MSTVYPNAIDGNTQLPLIVDNVNALQANDVNRIRNAVIAVEAELGINPSSTSGTVKDRMDVLEGLVEGLTGVSVVDITVDFISGMIETPVDKTYYIVSNIPYAGYIDSIVTQSTSGTCTLTVELNGTPLGGTANSVSSTEEIQVHTSANTFSSGDSVTLVISANNSTEDMRFTANIIRTS